MRKGDNINTKDVIGKVFTDESIGESILKFEVWKEKKYKPEIGLLVYLKLVYWPLVYWYTRNWYINIISLHCKNKQVHKYILCR